MHEVSIKVESVTNKQQRFKFASLRQETRLLESNYTFMQTRPHFRKSVWLHAKLQKASHMDITEKDSLWLKPT